jgi:uncharacterized protein YecT (DUF1311 family)
MLSLALAVPAGAGDAPSPRQIAPDRFAPSYRDAPAKAQAEAPIVAPSADHPLGACDRKARDWIACLDATTRLADGAVNEAEARVIASLEKRPSLNSVTRGAIATALKSADEEWRALRERECGVLALVERGVGGALYEARLVCRIRRDVERARALDERYGEGS